MISNLAQLKKYIGEGKTFKIVKQHAKPEFEGQIRKPSKTQTNAFYSKCINEHPEANKINEGNGGLGSWIEYGKASQWTFENNTASQAFKDGSPLWTIELLEA